MGRVAADLARRELGDGDRATAAGVTARRGASSTPATSTASALEQSEGGSQRDRRRRHRPRRGGAGTRRAGGRSGLRRPPGPRCPSRAAPRAKRRPSRVRSSRADGEPDLLLRLADCLGEGLAGTEVPAHGDVERARPGVLRPRTSLEEGERPAVSVDASDPDVECAVPVAVAVDVAAALAAPVGTPFSSRTSNSSSCGSVVGRSLRIARARARARRRRPAAR